MASTNVQDKYFPPRAWDYTNPRMPTDCLPIPYGDHTVGGTYGSWVCPCIDTSSHLYAVAGCEILSTANGNSFIFYDKDNSTATIGAHTINVTHNFEAVRTIATVKFSSSLEFVEPISVRCKGRHTSNALITNPVNQIEDFCENIVQMSSPFNESRLSNAKAFSDLKGYASAITITNEIEIGSVISDIISSFWGDWWIDKDGLIVIRLDAGNVDESEICFHLHPKWLSTARIRGNLRNICNQVIGEFSYSHVTNKFEDGDDGDSTKDASSQERYGKKKKTFQFKAIRNSTVANIVQDLFVTLFKDPPKEYDLEIGTMEVAHLERGDYIVINSDWILDESKLKIRNRVVKILSIEIDNNNYTTRLTVLDMGEFLTIAYLADGTYTANGNIKAGNTFDRTIYA